MEGSRILISACYGLPTGLPAFLLAVLLMDGVKWVSSSVSCYSFNHLQQTWKAFLIHVIWRRVERSVYLN